MSSSIGEIGLTSKLSEIKTTGTIIIDDKFYRWVAAKNDEEWNPVLQNANLLALQSPHLMRSAKARIRETLLDAKETFERIKAE